MINLIERVLYPYYILKDVRVECDEDAYKILLIYDKYGVFKTEKSLYLERCFSSGDPFIWIFTDIVEVLKKASEYKLKIGKKI